MRYLSRKKIYHKEEANKDAKKIYIFCEGKETEIRYFKYFQGLSSNIDILPIPNVNGQSDPVKLKENSDILFLGNKTHSPKFSLSAEYKDEVWFVIDTDRWNEGDKINKLKEFCTTNNGLTKQWMVAQSNPSFELWLFYHFNDTMPLKSSVEKYVSFKEFLDTTIKGGFDSRSMPVEIETAIINSIKNFHAENGQPVLFSTEVHTLGEVIVPFVKKQLDKAKEMMLNNEAL
jgi:hypothetical protein